MLIDLAPRFLIRREFDRAATQVGPLDHTCLPRLARGDGGRRNNVSGQQLAAPRPRPGVRLRNVRSLPAIGTAKPDAIVGHSSGDFVAVAALAPVSYDDAMTLDLARLWQVYDVTLGNIEEAGLLAVGAGALLFLQPLVSLSKDVTVAMDELSSSGGPCGIG